MSLDQFPFGSADSWTVRPRMDRHLHNFSNVQAAAPTDVLDLFSATEAIRNNEGALLRAIKMRRQFLLGDFDRSLVLLFFEAE